MGGNHTEGGLTSRLEAKGETFMFARAWKQNDELSMAAPRHMG
jgi:hypothetical protein